MTTEIAVVLGLALIAIVLFATEKLRIDAIALLVLSTLAVLGLVTPEQAVGGFSNPATVTVEHSRELEICSARPAHRSSFYWCCFSFWL